jgi:hypothetical protein
MTQRYYKMRKQEKLGQFGRFRDIPSSTFSSNFVEPAAGQFSFPTFIDTAGTTNGISNQFVPITDTPFIPNPINDIRPGRPAFVPPTPITPEFAPPSISPAELQRLIDEGVNEKLKKINQQTNLGIGVFTTLDPANDIVTTENELVTAGVWSDSISSLTTFFSSSVQTESQRRYYLDVYQKNPLATGAAVQFAVAYGHAAGSGSDSQGQLNDSATKAVYSQYRSLLLAPNDTRFTTLSGSTDSIYVINFKRSRLRERLDPGNFELPITSIATRAVNATGSVTLGTKVITLIDDSATASATIGESGKVYNIVSGSISTGIHNQSAPHYYGLAYPDHGVLIIDGNRLDQELSFKTQISSSVECNNHFALFHAISGSSLLTNPVNNDPFGFLARNSEKITSKHFFVRIKNGQYNFSNNPTYVTGSIGQIYEPSFRNGDPKSYVTTVGLYNDRQELLAIAKLSKPLLKSFNREALIRVKLDF